ncbi:NAD(P)H-hydrate dehydratase [Leptotrichia sp. OH3620_COT-345]|uniref:NAD(P)H-hydrate dehydratase n=1 Tax=Leptotrichia sp. OH3620_COT-345 TaxID=2491048 RepID=UPI000F646C20|nr:NAD(P)H-hydrate dehydratase [Leptotrichia sp. OH3620_COT-345]RRD40909.1 NAD(P)H-hydrate dehydratase [Leptotrichia sp. OH3620_COT-345]
MLIGGNDTTKKIDNYAITVLGVPGNVLMENAAVSFIKHMDMTSDSYLVICGKGNNGGDGYAIARQLHVSEKNVSIFCVDNINMSNDCKINYNICKKLNMKIYYDIKELEHLLINSKIIVDALFGTGLNSEVTGKFKDIIKKINKFSVKAKVYSVDIPSGINGDTGEIMGEAVKAFKTVSFVTYKKGFFNKKNESCFGNIEIENIGINENIFSELTDDYYLTKKFIRRYIIGRNKDFHKGNFGKVLIFAGSKGFSGAAKITVNSCVRSGAGLVTLLTYIDIVDNISSSIIEAMTIEIDNSCLKKNFEEIEKVILNSDVVAIGPGIGKTENSFNIFKKIINYKKNNKGNKINLVIDADGLNLLSENKKIFEKIKGRTVLTPHLVEFSRLTGITPENIEKNKFEICKNFALSKGVILLLKGRNTLITNGKKTYINSTGNPHMANGGMGDCLTGIIASLIGQNYGLIESANIGAFLHGYIADELLKKQYIINASHIIQTLPEYMRKLFI